MSKVKGRRKPLHSEITTLRRSKKAAVVEAPAPEVDTGDASEADQSSSLEVSEDVRPESEVNVDASAADAAEAEPSATAEAESPVDDAPDAAGGELGASSTDGAEGAPGNEGDFERAALDDSDPETATHVFEPSDEGRTASNVISIDGEAPDDMEAFLCGLIEALLFTSQRPLPLKDLARAAGIDRPRARELLERLMRSYVPRGINIDEVAGGYVLRSSPRYAPQIQKFLALRPVRLSRAQLETLAIIAYRQPVTKPEVDDIRGVDSGQVIKGLLDRDLLKTLGKKDEPGRPMLYGTTNDFLELLNLRSLGELPTLREYTELSDESKQKFAEETGEEAPNELPLAGQAAADGARDASAADATSHEANTSAEAATTADAEAAAEPEEPVPASTRAEAEADEAAPESAEGPPSSHDELRAGRADEDEDEEDVDEDDEDEDVDEDDEEEDVDEDDEEEDVDEDDEDEDVEDLEDEDDDFDEDDEEEDVDEDDEPLEGDEEK